MIYLDQITEKDAAHLERLASQFQQTKRTPENRIALGAGEDLSRYVAANIALYGAASPLQAIRDTRLRGQIIGLALLCETSEEQPIAIEHAWITPERNYTITLGKLQRQLKARGQPELIPAEPSVDFPTLNTP